MKKKYKHSEGYTMVYCPEHPASSNKFGFVYEHRKVMEDKLGRYLNGVEIVHHIDEDRSNNDISNLMLCENIIEHRRIHLKNWKKIKGKWFKECMGCKKWIEVNRENFFFRKSGEKKGRPLHKCKSCVGKGSTSYYRKNKHNPEFLEKRKYYQRKRREALLCG